MPTALTNDSANDSRPTPDMSGTPAWEEPGWARLPSLSGDVRADVCVVGLGGSGLSSVSELVSAGQSVVGLDAGQVAGGAAGRNGGFLLGGTAMFHHVAVAKLGRTRARRLYERTLGEIARMSAETPEAVRRSGSLRIAISPAEAEDCGAQLAAMRADALPVEPYEGPEGQGLLFPGDASFQPLRRCRILAWRAMDGGARLYEHTPALELSGTEVRTPAGRVHCERVIVAVDGRLERLLPELSGRVRTARLQMLATAPTAAVSLPRPVYARWGLDYWQQLASGCVVLGGARDVGGEGEWTVDARPTREVQEALERILRERLGVRAPVSHRWAAAVSYAATGLPVLEEVRPGVWAVGGYSGTGNVLGALCGRAAVELALAGHSELASEITSSA